MKSDALDRHLAVMERQERALELRRAGASPHAIGRQLGISAGAARKLVERALMRRVRSFSEAQEEVKTLEVERLDQLLLQVWRRANPVTMTCPGQVDVGTHEFMPTPDGTCPVHGYRGFATPPDQQAITRIMQIMERRAKLLGLDAPTKMEVLTLDVIDAEMRKLEAQMAMMGQDPTADSYLDEEVVDQA